MKDEFIKGSSLRGGEEVKSIIRAEQDQLDSSVLTSGEPEMNQGFVSKTTIEQASIETKPEAGKQQQIVTDSVNSGIRLLNFCIDFFIYLVLTFISFFVLDYLFPTVDQVTIDVLVYTTMAGLFVGYYGILECLFQQTMGKYMTRTKVVGLQGERPKAGAVWLRSVCRLIPIDWASYFFSRNGLHDILSGTKVVKDRKQEK